MNYSSYPSVIEHQHLAILLAHPESDRQRQNFPLYQRINYYYEKWELLYLYYEKWEWEYTMENGDR